MVKLAEPDRCHLPAVARNFPFPTQALERKETVIATISVLVGTSGKIPIPF